MGFWKSIGKFFKSNGGSLLGSVLDTAGNLASTYYSNEQARENARIAFEREAAYNNPISQMERLKLAGLNPYLIYGTGVSGASGNTHASMPNSQAYNLSGSFGKYMQLQSLHLNNEIARRTAKNIDAQNSLIYANASEVRARASALERENRLLGESVSSSDPWYYRLGSRAVNYFKSGLLESFGKR